ncbi:uncharacterized protein K452DRAFT_345340 [Aplosporella prunicola CBS 121167]|uniref:Uncharacterized protein n=1 Tax=Aplosporella prunicola CBS 121167 TaxID=1176127 RepID=A0A6A6BIJ9_9PEZI|nr:uncharacterized protein K452DRAFT_345340 [Aplosporella prunicola CBS 121167]KAF2143972.1 hypothetical protein K452DRAFT_345340 [Aplosporella prunicola CBS 121167]
MDTAVSVQATNNPPHRHVFTAALIFEIGFGLIAICLTLSFIGWVTIKICTIRAKRKKLSDPEAATAAGKPRSRGGESSVDDDDDDDFVFHSPSPTPKLSRSATWVRLGKEEIPSLLELNELKRSNTVKLKPARPVQHPPLPRRNSN